MEMEMEKEMEMDIVGTLNGGGLRGRDWPGDWMLRPCRHGARPGVK